MRETDPRTILKDLLPPETVLPPDLDDMTLWQIIINISEPPKRKKRKDINTLEDVVRLLQESKKILVLTGAGVCIAGNNYVLLCLCIAFTVALLGLMVYFSSGVCFLWNTRLSIQRWHLCKAGNRFPRSSRPSSNVWYRVLQKRPKAIFQVC